MPVAENLLIFALRVLDLAVKLDWAPDVYWRSCSTQESNRA